MKRKVLIMMICASMLAQTGAFAMSTKEFDKGMEKGINYFDQGLYYEAKDEFTWFRDYNKHNMNSGQLKYLEDYLQGAWNRIYAWEAYVKNRVVSGEQAIELVKNDCIGEYKHNYYAYKYNYYDKGNYYLVNAWVTKKADGTWKYKVYKDSGIVEFIDAGSHWTNGAEENMP